MIDIETSARAEEQRLTSLLFDCGIPEKQIKLLASVIENTAWMKAKLDDTREQIRNTSVAIPYDNGGGQTGIRENPLFKGYSALWKSYMSGMKQILDVIPADSGAIKDAEEGKAKSALELIRDKHKKGA